jgi:hypothetical protein
VTTGEKSLCTIDGVRSGRFPRVVRPARTKPAELVKISLGHVALGYTVNSYLHSAIQKIET